MGSPQALDMEVSIPNFTKTKNHAYKHPLC